MHLEDSDSRLATTGLGKGAEAGMESGPDVPDSVVQRWRDGARVAGHVDGENDECIDRTKLLKGKERTERVETEIASRDCGRMPLLLNRRYFR